jgi:hypothetical protein
MFYIVDLLILSHAYRASHGSLKDDCANFSTELRRFHSENVRHETAVHTIPVLNLVH